jgi:hypothetical protein
MEGDWSASGHYFTMGKELVICPHREMLVGHTANLGIFERTDLLASLGIGSSLYQLH